MCQPKGGRPANTGVLEDRGLGVALIAGGAQLDARGVPDDLGLVVTSEGGDQDLAENAGEDARGDEGTYCIQRTLAEPKQ